MSESDSISITSNTNVEEEESISKAQKIDESPKCSNGFAGKCKSSTNIPSNSLTPGKSHKKRQSLYVRMQTYQENLYQKLEEQAKKHTDEQLKHCTFRPKIRNKQYKRSFEDFLRDQEEHVQRKNQRINSMKLEQINNEISETTFRPCLGKKSLELSDKYTEGFSRPIKNLRKSEDLNHNLPSNTKPKVERRSQSIFEYLYNQHKEKTPAEPSEPEKVFKKSSKKILIDNFSVEFNRSFDELSSSGDLTYSLYVRLLQSMRFIKNNIYSSDFTEERALVLKLWKQTAEDTISKDRLLELLLKIMDFKPNDLRSEFLALYHNRRNCPSEDHSNDHPFKPSLSKHTKELAKNKKSERNNKDFLVNEKIANQNKWKLKQIANQKKEIEDCSFKPEIKHKRFSSSNTHKTGTTAYLWKGLRDENTHTSHRALNLYSLSVLLKEEKKRRDQDIREELEANLMNYSFEPYIRDHVLKGKKPSQKRHISFSSIGCSLNK